MAAVSSEVLDSGVPGSVYKKVRTIKTRRFRCRRDVGVRVLCSSMAYRIVSICLHTIYQPRAPSMKLYVCVALIVCTPNYSEIWEVARRLLLDERT